MGRRDEGVVVDQVGDVRIVSLPGEQDVVTAPRIRAMLGGAAESAYPVVVDLTECTFIDSSVVAVLLGACQAVGLGQFAVVIKPGSEPARLLDLVAFAAVVPVYKTRRAALAAMARPDAAG
jgi:anti-anti-sigma factor